ncbi:MAG: hypothetical protein AAB949_01090 [Patescibacteria group bacterium]
MEESNFSDIYNHEESEFQENFNRLQKIAECLRELGLKVVDQNISEESLKSLTAKLGFPIARDGLDGIRASYSKTNGLKIWFTNGFENPSDPERQRIARELDERGLI